MRWLNDRAAYTTLRRSITWLRLLPITSALIFESVQPSRGRPMRIAAMALCLAGPLAAASFLEAEHTGRLDQERLAGQTPAAIARRVFAIGGVWIVVGCVALLWAFATGGLTPYGLLVVTTMALVTATAGAIVCTTQMARDQIDPRINTAGLSVAAVGLGAIATGLLRLTPPARYFLLAIVPLLVIIAERARHLPARLAHPSGGELKRSAIFRPPPHAWLMNWPGFYRGWCLSASGFVLFTLFTPVLLLGWWLEPGASTEVAPLYAAPLVIGLIAVSLICREDLTTGRLEVIRQSSRRPVLAALEMIAGLWTPFVLAAAGLVLIQWLLFGLTLITLLAIAALAVLLAPLPAVEGWSGLWPAMTTIPFLLVMVTSRTGGPIVTLIVLIGVVWYAAIRLFENPDRPILTGVAAVLAPALIGAGAAFGPFILVEPVSAVSWLTAALFLTSQLLIEPRASREVRWGQPIALFLTTAVIFGVAGTPRLGLWAATIVVLGWFCALRIRQIRPERPALQAGIRITVMIVTPLMLDMPGYAPNTPLLDFSAPARLLAVAVAAAVLSEIGYRVSLVRARRPATLPA